jgi:hypothetical protein
MDFEIILMYICCQECLGLCNRCMSIIYVINVCFCCYITCVYKIFIYVYIGSDLPVLEPQVHILDLHGLNVKCRGKIVSRSALCLTKLLNKV